MKANGWLSWIAAAGLACLAAGCDEETTATSHQPAAGQGALVVENNIATDVDVFINGLLLGTLDSYEEAAWDFNPGVYRVVLDERDGDRSFGGDIDILEGRNTVLDVMVEPGTFGSYRVTISVEEPEG